MAFEEDAEGATRSLTRDELARAVRVEGATVDELVEWGFIQSDPAGRFRPSDIQRVRAVMAMRSPGIELSQLIEAFRQRLFTLQPMDLLYPSPAVVTDTIPAELASQLGLSEAELVRTMITAGFPAPVKGSPMRADDIALAHALVTSARQLGGDDLLGRFARTFGDAARRAAESGVAMFAENVSSPVVDAGQDDARRMEVNQLAAGLMASSEVLLSRLYRRHLESTLLSMWATAAESFLDQIGVRPARPASDGMAFVDLTGYTALTEHGGDSAAVRFADRLAQLADDAAARFGGRVVKLLGDGAMLHFEDPLDAVRGALALVDAIDESELPAAHAGANFGPVIQRDGDYFGRTVNLAARISAQASPGEVLVSPELASLRSPDLAFRPIGSRELKGIGSIHLFQAGWAEA
jgi:adenylate cyclase